MRGYGVGPNGKVWRYWDMAFLRGYRKVEKKFNKLFRKYIKKRARKWKDYVD